MIKLKQLNGDDVVVNADLITFVHAHPDTVITLSNGDKLMVEESMDEVINRVVAYKKRIMSTTAEKEER